jgi:phosphate transport system ATP-binding protein
MYELNKQKSKLKNEIDQNDSSIESFPFPILESRQLSAFFGNKQVLFDIDLQIPKNNVVAIIGPSGCGKTTWIRCLNRLHEMTPGARVEGEILLDQVNIYNKRVDPMAVRRKIGMVFQKPNPFPTMSIYDNVAAGIKLLSWRKPNNLNEIVENALKRAALWDEVYDNLKAKGTFLSGGQQQRLCIARALAIEPEVLLMDEPTSALDPISTSSVEDLIIDLKKNYTVVIITHNIQQAARISDYTAFFYLGKLIEYGKTDKMFENPKEDLTEKYISGRFG